MLIVSRNRNTTASIVQAKYSSMRSMVPPNERMKTTARMSAGRDPGLRRLVGRARHAAHPRAKQRRRGAARQRRPAKLEEAEDRVEHRPELRTGLEAHDAAVDRFARVERVADGLEIEDHLQADGDGRDEEDRRRVLHRGGRSDEPLAAADRGGGHDGARADNGHQVAQAERRRCRQLRHVPARQRAVIGWKIGVSGLSGGGGDVVGAGHAPNSARLRTGVQA